jgi:hypothetical protein
MTNLTVFDFNAQGIRFENRDGQTWVSLTDMAKASGKLVADWSRLKSTIEYLEALKSNVGIPIISNSVGGGVTNDGTWAIDEVAIEFAGWCSVEFKIWVNRQIKTLMSTGKVELAPLSTADMLIQMALAYKEHEQRLSAIELENIQLKAQLAAQSELIEVVSMESEANTSELERFRNGHGYWYSIIGYASKHGIKDISVQRAATLGRKASAMCKQRGLVPQKISDPRFGNVNTYPDILLDELDW